MRYDLPLWNSKQNPPKNLTCQSALRASVNWPTTCGGRGSLKPRASLENLIMTYGDALGIIRSVYCKRSASKRLVQASKDKEYLALYDALFEKFDAYFTKQSWTQKAHPEFEDKPVAYFSMEFGLHETLPIYSGGLGVLAGDHLKESSDLGLPLIAVGFMYAQGYFSQRISEDGWQEAINNPLTFEHLPVSLVTKNNKPVTIQVEFPDRNITAQIWEVRVGRVPLYLLDSNVEGNNEFDRLLTARLYWSDLDRRVMQEVLLGVGGVRALRALGYSTRSLAHERRSRLFPDP